jgi:acyl-homoserine lactone acylase PvdQ
MANTTPQQKLESLKKVLDDLTKTYGNWRQPWGDINRYQRVADGQRFDDSKPSIAVPLSSSRWGSLPAFESRSGNGFNKRYGTSGNSFIAAVEFGKRLKAKTILTGGQSTDPNSPNFTDQADGFVNGKFKDIFFYKEDVLKNKVKTYHPGER